MIRAAGAEGAPDATEALDALCRIYWLPVYAYIRRHGNPPEKAKDLAQDYFQHLIGHNLAGQADEQRGRFRSFLLLTLKHFLTDAYRRVHARKRGSEQVMISLDAMDPEGAYLKDPVQRLSPEDAFDRRWAEALVRRVMNRLEEEFTKAGKEAMFRELSGFLPGGQDERSYAEVGRALRLSENLVKVRVYRLRQRFGEMIREEIAETVSSRDELEQELQHLIAVLCLPQPG